MWAILGSIFTKGNGAKLGATAAGGTGLITLIFSLYGNISNKIEDSQKDQGSYMREYVELTIRPITTELKYQNKEIRETKELVKDLHKHILKGK